jgi:hypothetical protein
MTGFLATPDTSANRVTHLERIPNDIRDSWHVRLVNLLLH